MADQEEHTARAQKFTVWASHALSAASQSLSAASHDGLDVRELAELVGNEAGRVEHLADRIAARQPAGRASAA